MPFQRQYLSLKLLLLYSRLSGYLLSCLRELKDSGDIEIAAITYRGSSNAPFEFEAQETPFSWEKHSDELEYAEILEISREFNPEVVIMSGWMNRKYLRTARELRRTGTLTVAGCDTQWAGGAKQICRSLLGRLFLHQAIDVLWVTGERQRQLAQKLGYQGANCWEGFYSCDWRSFAIGGAKNQKRENSFLFVGRYAHEKGIDTLARAYQIYRQEADNPWELLCAGKGPLQQQIVECGATDLGFLQPRDLPKVMGKAGAFVLPSRSEPWGVVIHEAATAGCPLIVSHACGAGVHLVRDNYNGHKALENDARDFAKSMLRISSLSEEKRIEMGRNSHQLSQSYTPKIWTSTFLTGMKAAETNIHE